MTKADMFARWRRREHVTDFDIAICDHDTVNQQLNQLAALGEGGVRETLGYPLAKCVHRGHDLCDDVVLVHLNLQVLLLPLERATLVVQPPTPLAILRERHRSRLVGITHPLKLARDMLDPPLQLGASRLQVLWQPRSGLRPLERLCQTVGMRQHVAQVLPDEVIHA